MNITVFYLTNFVFYITNCFWSFVIKHATKSIKDQNRRFNIESWTFINMFVIMICLMISSCVINKNYLIDLLNNDNQIDTNFTIIKMYKTNECIIEFGYNIDGYDYIENKTVDSITGYYIGNVISGYVMERSLNDIHLGTRDNSKESFLVLIGISVIGCITFCVNISFNIIVMISEKVNYDETDQQINLQELIDNNI